MIKKLKVEKFLKSFYALPVVEQEKAIQLFMLFPIRKKRKKKENKNTKKS